MPSLAVLLNSSVTAARGINPDTVVTKGVSYKALTGLTERFTCPAGSETAVDETTIPVAEVGPVGFWLEAPPAAWLHALIVITITATHNAGMR
ncbi:hypothetical protein ABIB25_000659 [Nakamurella sp. UYEF19]|uniref:hypothetical protein n=1 Tax=Nakamurella sp. UYEF19 TaxID=1756392 RepID=UPI003391D949